VNAAIVSAFKSSCGRYMKKKVKSVKKVEGKEKTPEPDGPGSQNGELNAMYRVSPVTLAKAIKNEAEIEGMKNSHLRYYLKNSVNLCSSSVQTYLKRIIADGTET
jgi:Xaa-Pro aminopeptidase